MDAPTPCPNCGARNDGDFCPVCGQRQDVRVPTLRQWLGEVFEDLFALDARLPRTLKSLLLRPGELTDEWRTGRRRAYVHPFRLFLVASAVMFGLGLLLSRDYGTLPPLAELDVGSIASGRAQTEAIQTWGPQVFFLLVPFFAVLVQIVFYRGSGRHYIEHLVFAFHVHTFAFLVMAAIVLADQAPTDVEDVLILPLLFVIPLYVVLALRRAYGSSWVGATLKTVGLLGGHVLIGVAGGFIVLFLLANTQDPEALRSDANRIFWRVMDPGPDEPVLDGDERRELISEGIVRYERLEAYARIPHTYGHLARLWLEGGRPAEALRAARHGLLDDSTEFLSLAVAATAARELGDTVGAAGYRLRWEAALGVDSVAEIVARDRHRADLDTLVELGQG